MRPRPPTRPLAAPPDKDSMLARGPPTPVGLGAFRCRGFSRRANGTRSLTRSPSLAAARRPPEQPSATACAIRPTVRRSGAIWWLLVAGALALTALADWSILSRGRPVLPSGTPWWASALTVLAIAAWWADRDRKPVGSYRWTPADTGVLLTVAATAAFYRLWDIGRYPPPTLFAFEEYQAGGDAYNTLQNWWNVQLEFPLTNLLPALSFRCFGLSSFALRGPFIVSGIVAPVFLYLALRRVAQRPAAWAGAMLLATNRWA